MRLENDVNLSLGSGSHIPKNLRRERTAREQVRLDLTEYRVWFMTMRIFNRALYLFKKKY